MLRRALSHSAIALFWLLHFLPLSMLAHVGRWLGVLLYRFGGSRRRIALTNLSLCFPDLGEEQRQALAREHFRALGRSILERSLLWWASPERLSRLIRVSGAEQISALRDAGRPVILLAPHFLGLDAGGIGIAMRKGQKELKQQLDEAIDTIRKNGTYAKIAKKYFDFDPYGQ